MLTRLSALLLQDFGTAMTQFVVVDNCSSGVDYKMTGKMFRGLAQTGAWACLDVCNHTEVQILSVVALQIATVMQVSQSIPTHQPLLFLLLLLLLLLSLLLLPLLLLFVMTATLGSVILHARVQQVTKALQLSEYT